MDVLLDSNVLKSEPEEPEDRYRFTHIMFQEAAYASLLIKVRQRYHQQIAEHFIDSDHGILDHRPELVAFHYGKTEQIPIAIELWLRAGRQAIATSAFREAISHLRQSLSLVTTLEPDDYQRGSELAILLDLGVALTAVHGYHIEEVKVTYEQAYVLADVIGDEHQQWTALFGLWRCMLCEGDFTSAVQYSVKLKGNSSRNNNRTLEMTTWGIQAMTRMVTARFDAAEKFFDRSTELYDPKLDRHIGVEYGQDPYVTIRSLGAVNKLILNRIPESQTEIAQAIEVARQVGHPYTIAEALRIAAMYQQISRNMERLEKVAAEAAELSKRYGFDGFLAASSIYLAFSNVVRYRNQNEAITIRENLELYERHYGMLFLPFFQSILAEAQLYLGQYSEAHQTASSVLAMGNKLGDFWMAAPLLCIQAESASRGNLASPSEVDASYQKAKEMAVSQQADLFLSRIIQSAMSFGFNSDLKFELVKIQVNLTNESRFPSTLLDYVTVEH